MSDEGSGTGSGTYAGAAVPAQPAAPSEDVDTSSVYEQLVALREAALNDVDIVRRDLTDAERVVVIEKARLKRAAATAIDAGVDLEVVAERVHMSTGTVRSWAKALAGE